MEKLRLNSEKIKTVLNRFGWSERELARRIDTSQALVNYWITRRSLSGAVPIAKALDLDPKDLVC